MDASSGRGGKRFRRDRKYDHPYRKDRSERTRQLFAIEEIIMDVPNDMMEFEAFLQQTTKSQDMCEMESLYSGSCTCSCNPYPDVKSWDLKKVDRTEPYVCIAPTVVNQAGKLRKNAAVNGVKNGQSPLNITARASVSSEEMTHSGEAISQDITVCRNTETGQHPVSVTEPVASGDGLSEAVSARTEPANFRGNRARRRDCWKQRGRNDKFSYVAPS